MSASTTSRRASPPSPCAQVQDVAQRYLQEDSRTVGHFVPTNPARAAALRPPAPPAGPHLARACAYRSAAPAPAAAGRRPGDGACARQLRQRRHRDGLPQPRGARRWWSWATCGPARCSTRPGKHGLASFTADMLERGTEKRTFQQLNEELDSVGASLHVGAGGHTAGFVGKGLVEDCGACCSMLMADVMRHPTFPAEEMRKLRGEIVADLYEMDDDTGHVASQRFRELLLPGRAPLPLPRRRLRG